MAWDSKICDLDRPPELPAGRYTHVLGQSLITGAKAEHLGPYAIAAISTPNIEKALSSYLSGQFNYNSTLYDSVLDAVYNTTRVGGSISHHNLDGAHTIAGAMKTLRGAFPNDSSLHLASAAIDHLSRDFTTSSGINPFMRPAEFTSLRSFLIGELRFPPSVANDLLNFNAAELVAAACATVALLTGMRHGEQNVFAESAGRFMCLGWLAGNPLMLLLATVALGQALWSVWNGSSAASVGLEIAGGAVSAATFVFVAAQFSGPLFLGLAAAASACFAVRWLHLQAQSLFASDLDQTLAAQFAGYRSIVV